MYKAFKGEAIVNELLRALNNTADERFQLARWVKIDEKKHCPTCHSWLTEGKKYTIRVK